MKDYFLKILPSLKLVLIKKKTKKIEYFDTDRWYTFNFDTESVVCSRITLDCLSLFTKVIVLIVFTIGKLSKLGFKFKGADSKIEEDLAILPIKAVKIIVWQPAKYN